MDQSTCNGIDAPQREFVYRVWERALSIQGQDAWVISRHVVVRKTSSLIYAHCVPYLGEQYDWGQEKSVFEISRREIEQLGSSWVFLMRATFYLSEAAARAAIPKRVQLKPTQAAYFGLSRPVTLWELQLAYYELAFRLDPAQGGSAEAFAELEDHYQAARLTMGK